MRIFVESFTTAYHQSSQSVKQCALSNFIELWQQIFLWFSTGGSRAADNREYLMNHGIDAKLCVAGARLCVVEVLVGDPRVMGKSRWIEISVVPGLGGQSALEAGHRERVLQVTS